MNDPPYFQHFFVGQRGRSPPLPLGDDWIKTSSPNIHPRARIIANLRSASVLRPSTSPGPFLVMLADVVGLLEGEERVEVPVEVLAFGERVEVLV